MTRLGLKEATHAAASIADRGLSHAGARLERPALIAFLFHSLFEDEGEIERDVVYPQEAVTRAGLARLIEYFLGAGYRFVGVEDIDRGLAASDHCVWLTFDDGYASNRRLVDVVREYEVPATLFVTTGYVATGRRFWWDAVYSERRRRGQPVAKVEREIESLKRKSLDFIESYLKREFGSKASRPQSDLDRPLTADELKALARCTLVGIGNHTMDHPILASLDREEIHRQIIGAQDYLREVAGVEARGISYPNGSYDTRVVGVARELGLSVGVTTVQRKNRVPALRRDQLELGRFRLERARDLRTQARMARSELQITNTARRMRRLLGRV